MSGVDQGFNTVTHRDLVNQTGTQRLERALKKSEEAKHFWENNTKARHAPVPCLEGTGRASIRKCHGEVKSVEFSSQRKGLKPARFGLEKCGQYPPP